MNTTDLKKNCKEELIIYIEKMSRDMTRLQEENLELRRNVKYQNGRKDGITWENTFLSLS